MTYFGMAVRTQPGGGVDYLVDPRHRHHDLLGELVTATRRALQTLAPARLDEPGDAW